MRRRTFIQSLAAAGALGLPLPRSLAEVASRDPGTLLPLVRIYDAMPEEKTPDNKPAEAPASGLFELVSIEFVGFCPLLIGLGAAAESLVDEAQARGIAPEDAGLYRTDTSGQAAAAINVALLAPRLNRCASALLLIDGQDPQALAEGLAWARRLEREDVYLRTALLLGAIDPRLVRAWQAAAGTALHQVLEVRTRPGTLTPAASVRALLYGLPFFTPSLICVDLSDLRRTLLAGPQARTTAVRWTHGDLPPEAVDNACRFLDPPQQVGGALAWMHAGHDFRIDEFDQLGNQLGQHLRHDALLVVSTVTHPNWRAGRRALSLTLVGDWS